MSVSFPLVSEGSLAQCFDKTPAVRVQPLFPGSISPGRTFRPPMMPASSRLREQFADFLIRRLLELVVPLPNRPKRPGSKPTGTRPRGMASTGASWRYA